MTIQRFLKQYQLELTEAGIPSARLDVLILLEDILGHDRSWILAHPEETINNQQVNKLKKQLARRASHEPLAYIRGFTDFYGRRFKVNKRVLEPRPESETMVSLLKNIDLNDPVIADVGTGSGCLGITAALELPGSTVDLYDIDSSALAVAKHNAAMHELQLDLRKRDLLNKPLRQYDVILANLPYVPEGWKINEPAMQEPRLAIFGGKDGLDLYRRLFRQIQKYAWTPLYVFTESLPPQHKQLAETAKEQGFTQIAEQDFIQVFLAIGGSGQERLQRDHFAVSDNR